MLNFDELLLSISFSVFLFWCYLPL